MRNVFLASLLATAACTSGAPTDTSDTDTDTVANTDGVTQDTDVVVDTDTGGAGDTDVTPPYEGGSYKVSELRIAAAGHGRDLNGDGKPDNQVAVLLGLIDGVLGPGVYNIATVNARIDTMLFEERAIVLIDVKNDAGALTFDVLQGDRDLAHNLIVDPSSFNDLGDPKSRMLGEMKTADTFDVGPSPLAIPVQFYTDEPVIEIAADQAFLFGDIDATKIDGNIAAVITSSAIMDGVVKPLIDSEFGLDTQEGQYILSTAQTLVDLNADLTVGDEPALSAAFTFKAEDATWVH